jgi:hypothetical protein
VSNKKKIQADGRTAQTPRSVEEDSEDDSEVERPITARSSVLAGPRTPARMPVQDAGRPLRTPRRSSSDTVDDYPSRPIPRPRRSLSDLVEDVYLPRSDYKYTPLKGDEIRLLIVHPGLPGQEIKCSLVPESLKDSRPFQALSYLWGQDKPNKPIMILSFKSGGKSKSFRDLITSRIYTRTNLFEALKQLRHPVHDVTLYVNAICIDHNNKVEKYFQSARTQEIFNKASNVIVWLGIEKPTSKTAFEFIPKVLDMNGFDRLIKEESNTKSQSWDALAELMRNPLFSRRWLIQELAVAKNAALHCGTHTIPWTSFSDAVALFEANLSEVQRYFKFSLASGGPIKDIRALGASTLVSVVNNIIRKTPDGLILNRLESVETLVSMLAVFEAADPLDTIIAVMGMAKDRAQVESITSGDRELRDKYIEFVLYCVKSSGSIDIICRHWAPIIKEKASNYFERSQLPSWIPNVSGSAFGAPGDKDKDKQSGRVHGDSFVGLPEHRIYKAAAGFPLPTFTFGLNPHPDPTIQYPQYDGTITVKGYPLGPISELSPRAAKGFLFQECLEMGGWTPHSLTVPERLWRTLVADRGPDNTKPPSWYHRACLHCLEQSGTDGDIDTTAILNQPKCLHTVADFLRRVQSVIWNRRVFMSNREVGGEKLFGLVPGGTKLGDYICILYGCSVPVVLREHKTLDDHYFEVVGESFVYGMMDGEAREGLLDEEVEAMTMTFKLR